MLKPLPWIRLETADHPNPWLRMIPPTVSSYHQHNCHLGQRWMRRTSWQTILSLVSGDLAHHLERNQRSSVEKLIWALEARSSPAFTLLWLFLLSSISLNIISQFFLCWLDQKSVMLFFKQEFQRVKAPQQKPIPSQAAIGACDRNRNLPLALRR